VSQLELLVLLALMRLDQHAYGVAIAAAIAAASRREVALGSIYIALQTLEQKRLVSSELGEPTAARGGRAKCYFRISAQGIREVSDIRQTLSKMWRGLSQLAEG
jgi:DNA-binding PadR family transcriptional regulator